jgi:DNA-binding protein HU-beta
MSKDRFIATFKDKGTFTSLAEAARIRRAVLESLTEAMGKDGSVPLRGFGSLHTVDKAARQGRNPRTGKSINIPAGKRIVFTPGSRLKEAATALHWGKGLEWLEQAEFARDMRAQIGELKLRIEDYGRLAHNKGEDAVKVYKEHKERFDEVCDETGKRLGKLAANSSDAWIEVRGGLEKAFAELGSALQKARTKF